MSPLSQNIQIFPSFLLKFDGRVQFLHVRTRNAYAYIWIYVSSKYQRAYTHKFLSCVWEMLF